MPAPVLSPPPQKIIAYVTPWYQRGSRETPGAGSGGSESSPLDPTGRPQATSPKPIDISDVPELRDGFLNVGLDIDYAPLEFLRDSGKNPEGLDADLANVLAQKLGVQARFHPTHFDEIIKALKARRFDVIISAMTITEERSQEIDFIPYLATPAMGTGMLVVDGNPKGVRRLEDLCGLKVAVQAGSIQVQEVSNVACANKKVKINLSTFRSNQEAIQQLKKGRVDVYVADLPVVNFVAQEIGGTMAVDPKRFQYVSYGIGLRQGSTQLQRALNQALRAIKDDGSYGSILGKWGF